VNPPRGHGPTPALRALVVSGLPVCWAAELDALRPPGRTVRAVRKAAQSLDRMPTAYRWPIMAALHLFPLAFGAVTGHGPRQAPPETLRRGMERLRHAPGYAMVLRTTTALAMYGALDGARGGAQQEDSGGTRDTEHDGERL
jgi:hypothetical protein